MKLSQAVQKECLSPRWQCADKNELLREASRLAKECEALRDFPEERILEGFKDREATSSTGIGEGIALPHCRIPGVPRFVVGLITLDPPIDFDAIDDKKVNIVAFIVGPDTNTIDHPRILSGLSLVFTSEENRKNILSASTPQELLDAMVLEEKVAKVLSD